MFPEDKMELLKEAVLDAYNGMSGLNRDNMSAKSHYIILLFLELPPTCEDLVKFANSRISLNELFKLITLTEPNDEIFDDPFCTKYDVRNCDDYKAIFRLYLMLKHKISVSNNKEALIRPMRNLLGRLSLTFPSVNNIGNDELSILEDMI